MASCRWKNAIFKSIDEYDQDDGEWHHVLEEAGRTSRSGALLRELFVIILRFCLPSDPRKLFDDHWEEWKDDYQSEAGWRDVLILSDAQINQVIKQNCEIIFTQPPAESEGALRSGATPSVMGGDPQGLPATYVDPRRT